MFLNSLRSKVEILITFDGFVGFILQRKPNEKAKLDMHCWVSEDDKLTLLAVVVKMSILM